ADAIDAVGALALDALTGTAVRHEREDLCGVRPGIHTSHRKRSIVRERRHRERLTTGCHQPRETPCLRGWVVYLRGSVAAAHRTAIVEQHHGGRVATSRQGSGGGPCLRDRVVDFGGWHDAAGGEHRLIGKADGCAAVVLAGHHAHERPRLRDGIVFFG